MSKIVLLFRHGKSDWNASYGRDHDRPLNERGERASKAMGRWLADTGPIPNFVLCSTAVRARSTYDLASQAGKWTCDVEYEQGLYHATPEDLIHYLREVSNHVGTVMMVGHQPTWAMTTELLSNRSTQGFPTASIVRIDLNVDQWFASAPGVGRLIWHKIPKQL